MSTLPVLLMANLLAAPPQDDARPSGETPSAFVESPAAGETTRSLPGVPETYDTTPHVRPVGARTLTLGDVLASVEASNPRIEAASQRIEAAKGARRAARGGFDPKLGVAARFAPVGYYRNAELDTYVEAPTPLWGIGFFGGYRIGRGRYPIYDGKRSTGSFGELRAGVNVPLWQDGPIDSRRAAIQKAELDLDAESLQREFVGIDVRRAASNAYWDWVAAGLRLDIENRLLDLAKQRDDALFAQAKAGLLPPIEAVDNERLVVDRQRRVVTAERDLERASLTLGLYVRDERGNPAPPTADQLPITISEATEPRSSSLPKDVETAIASRPDAAVLRIAARKLEVDQRLARNQRSAAIDLRGMVAKDFGAADPTLDDSLVSGLLPVEVQTGLSIEVPIPLRKARGDLERVRADKRRVDLDVRWLSDRIEMEVRSAHASLVAAYRNVSLARRAVAVSERLAEAERRRFVRGDSDLIRVNLREIAATDAATAEVDALAAYHRAVADYVAAVGGPSLVVVADAG